MPNKELKLRDTIILFDRDLGVSIFQDFRGYDNLEDDAEWLLERTPQKSRGFLIRPVNNGKREGIWIGRYGYNSSRVIEEDIILDRNASLLGKMISDHGARKITEKKIMKRLATDKLKKKIKSQIVQDFKYYICPVDRLYYSCAHVERVYRLLKEKCPEGKEVQYSLVAEEIAKTRPCEEVVVCPLLVPNHFERVLNLNKALKSRKIGEISIIGPDKVRIT